MSKLQDERDRILLIVPQEKRMVEKTTLNRALGVILGNVPAADRPQVEMVEISEPADGLAALQEVIDSMADLADRLRGEHDN